MAEFEPKPMVPTQKDDFDFTTLDKDSINEVHKLSSNSDNSMSFKSANSFKDNKDSSHESEDSEVVVSELISN